MKQRLIRFLATSLGTALLTATMAAGAAAYSVSNVPLFVTTGVQPNVMILFDNSGSMDNLLWDEGYDPGVTYPNWTRSCAWGTSGSGDQRDYNRQNGIYCNSDPTGQITGISNWSGGTSTGTGSTDPRQNISCPSGYYLGRRAYLTSNPAQDPPTNSRPNVTRVSKCLKFPSTADASHTMRYSENYLNYLFEIADNGSPTVNTGNSTCQASETGFTATCKHYQIDLTTTAVNTAVGIIEQKARIQSARNVATNIITNNPNLRFGLTRFNAPVSGNSGPGGTVVADCGTTTATLTTTISAFRADTNTPLAEAYYEITRYFRGFSRVFGGSGSYTSPIQYRCQKNFVIVVTDGFPTYDNNVPTNDSDDIADAAHALPNWDGLSPSTSTSDFPGSIPQYSDGFQPSSSEGTEGYTLYLDDLAKFAFDTDMRKTGNDTLGVSFNDPSFPLQNLETYTVGLSINNQMLIDAAQYGNGQNFSASSEAQLSTALQLALSDIAAKTSSASAVATNSTRLTANSFIYQARFSTGDWSGQLLAFQLATNGSVAASPTWNAATVLPAAASRNIFSYNGSAGITFDWASLSATQKTAMNTNVIGVIDANGSARLDYIRGIGTNEAPAVLNFRPRTNKLGDIVNSDPVFVGNQDLGYGILPGTEGSSYNTYITSGTASTRTKMVYVGANDGMLHGFNTTNGVEVLAYVPNLILPNLKYLTDINYNNAHKYFVDGSPAASDAYIGGAWKTFLLGTLGAGGKGVFALDITNPSSFTASNVKWEFTEADMGLSIPQATIARMYDGNWAAIVSNGYNSSSEKAVLYVLNLNTGAVIKKFDTGATGSNGLSSATPSDVNADGIVDFIYAGDLLGNMWKFDVRNANASNWTSALLDASSNPIPLSVSCDGTSSTGSPATACTVRQPITARPEVTINPQGGLVVLFGTGRYFASGDNNVAGAQTQTFYGIKDKNLASGQTTIFGRASLQQQTVLITTTIGTRTVRATSNNSVSSSQNGWYLNLPSLGERVVATPQVRSGRIIFTSLIPSTDPCGFGGDSFLYELDALTGSRLNYAAFDVNGDGNFDQGDFVDIGGGVLVPASGLKSLEGIIKTPTCLSTGGAKEYCYASGTSGGIEKVIGNLGPGTGRQSWRQLQ